VLRRVDGIWRALPAERMIYYEKFIRDYETIRQAEGRGSKDANYYLSLPYQDSTGNLDWQWQIRGATYRCLENEVWPKIEELYPQGCDVHSFKEPTQEELAHDFLWRIHKVTPAKGEMGIFNRSHYEDVLVARVRNLVPEKVWSRRYEEINNFEQLLSQNGMIILKFFLHISYDEQERRLLV
jgi:hypothetical protein